MIGVSVSRWTMSYFAVAVVFLIAAEILMAIGYGFPAAALQAPETLVLVHLVTIGWLSLLMCGALFQFVPVLVAQPLHSNMLPLPTLVAMVGGLAALILGFLQLAGNIDPAPPFFVLAAILLGAGFALVLWNLARTLWAAPARPLPAWFVSVGLLSGAATVALGIVFALVLGGATIYVPFVALSGAGLPLHVIAGFGGWLTFTAMGVSYRLLAMFMLAPELDRPSTKAALYLGTAALTATIVGGLIAILAEGRVILVLAAAGALGLATFALYTADMRHLFRARKRPRIELNSRMATLALASLSASVALIIVLLILGDLADRVAAVAFLLAFGWLSGLGLAQLYKIVAFLSWLECYGPVLGKTTTPRVQDLVVEARAAKWFWLYFAAVWTATGALIGDCPAVFQLCAAAMLIATVGIGAQLVRTRRLADVKSELRLPHGAHRPRLLFALSHRT